MEELSEKYKTELEALKSERSRLIKEAKEEAQRITSEANKQIENTIRVIRESQADRDKTLIVRRKMEAFKQSLESEEPAVQDEAIDRKIEQIRQREQRRAEKRNKKTTTGQPTTEPVPEKKRPLEPGSKVRIIGQEGAGEIVSLNGKRATVAIGQILTTIQIDRLEAISNAEYKKTTRSEQPTIRPLSSYSTIEQRMQFSPRIDVRGMRVTEALEKVQEFVDQAIMLGYPDLQILHGKGTGALKEEIRNYLRTVDLVQSAKDEQEDLGGAGITVVKLDL